MSDIWKIRLLAAGFIPAGLLGIIFVDPTQSNAPLGILVLKLFGTTGAIWIFRVTCAGFIILPIAVYWLHLRSERRVNAYFKRQSMIAPESDHTTRRQQ
jgi:hypothetical protein